MRFTCSMQIVCVAFSLLATPTWTAFIKLTGLDCLSVDPSYLVFENCIIKAQNRDIKEISVAVKLLQLPVTNVTIRGDIRRRFKPPFYSYNIDGCIFMQSNRRNPIADAVYKFLRLEFYSNLNHSCPYNHDVIVDRLRLDKTFNLPVPIGTGEYVITTHWHTYNKPRAITHINFLISG
ncbi:uncharacterized protein LOC135429806 [Drosophila montana]|uniref:uncharacterized protein LOC135429806 n=1 Tax=Drosophila montana TaxID=40370 RepID=UPI00313D3262